MKKLLITFLIALPLTTSAAWYNPFGWFSGNQSSNQLGAADPVSYTKTLLPITDSTSEVGTSTKAYLRVTTDELCLTGDSCKTAWPTGSGSSFAWPFTPTSYGVSTSTTIGLLNGFLSTASSTIVGNATTTGTLAVSGNVYLGSDLHFTNGNIIAPNSSSFDFSNAAGDVYFGGTGANGLDFGTGGAQRLHLDSSGNIFFPSHSQGFVYLGSNGLFATVSTSTALASKQDVLVSGTNIKTINGSSVLGSGDLTVVGATALASSTPWTFGSLVVAKDNGSVTTIATSTLKTSQLTNDAGFLTSLAGAASSTLLGDTNSWTGVNRFGNASSTYHSFGTASTTNLNIGGQTFIGLLGTGLTNSSNILTNSGVISASCSGGTSCSGTNPLSISSFVFPFTANTGYNSTTTVLGLNGFFSTASSTVSGNFFLPALTQGFSYIGSNGKVNSIASSSVQLSWFNNDSNFITDGNTGWDNSYGFTTFAWPFTPISAGVVATTSQINLAGFLSTASSTIVGNATTTGSHGAGAIYVNGDYITDFTGTNLSVTNGVLNAAGGGSGVWPFTPTTHWGQTVQSTSTALLLQGSPKSLFASSSVVMDYSSTTNEADAQFFVATNYSATSTFNGNLFLQGRLDLGQNTAVGGFGSAAIGYLNTVSNDQSLVVGESNTQRGFDSILYGRGNTNAGGDYTLIGGQNNSAGLGDWNVVLGSANTTANGSKQYVIGASNTTLGSQPTFIFGDGNTTNDDEAVAIGQTNQATGYSSVALGNNNIASTNLTFAFGNSVTLVGYNAMALGQSIYSGATSSITIGQGVGIQHANRLKNLSHGSIAFGVNSDIPTLTISSSTGINSVGKVGIGTTTPAWGLQIASSTPSGVGFLGLSDTNAGTNLKHWTFSSQGGNLYIATSSDTYATSTVAALQIDANGKVKANCFTVDGSTCLTAGTGILSYDAWTHPAAGQSATTSLMLLYGQASSTLLSSNWLKIGGTASTTIGTDGNVTIEPLTASRAVFTDSNKTLTTTGTVGAIESAVGSQNILLETEIDACSELAGLLDAETGGCNGTSGPVFPDAPAFSGIVTMSGRLGIGTTTPWYQLTIASTTGPQFALSEGVGIPQWTFRNAGGNLYFATTTVAGTSTSTPFLSILNTGNALFGTTTPWLNSALNVVGTTTVKGQLVSIAASTTANTTQTIDWSTGNTQKIMLTGNTNIVMNATSSNPIDGGKYTLKICQDPTGSRTLTWANPVPLRWWNGTTTITSTANKCTFIGFIYTTENGNSIYSGVASSTNIDIR